MNKKICKIISSMLVLTFLLVPMQALAVEMEDVSPDDWFYRDVRSGLRLGIIKGTSEDSFRFEPNRSVTRAEFITMLGRLHEYGNETIGIPGEGEWYERYLNWAVEMGIIHGNATGDLMPYAFITREQMVVIVHRYLIVFGLWEYIRIEGYMTMGTFLDHSLASYWAQSSIESFRLRRLVRVPPGFSFQHFRPLDNATRAEALALLIAISR